MNTAKVAALLAQRLASTGLLVVPENGKVVVSAASRYVCPTFIPADPKPLGMGQGYRLRGIFQVDVFGLVGEGTDDVSALVQVVLDAFPLGSGVPASDGFVRFENTGRRSGRIDGGRYVVPVQVQFRADLQEV
jgi:hypothetical protein